MSLKKLLFWDRLKFLFLHYVRHGVPYTNFSNIITERRGSKKCVPGVGESLLVAKRET